MAKLVLKSSTRNALADKFKDAVSYIAVLKEYFGDQDLHEQYVKSYEDLSSHIINSPSGSIQYLKLKRTDTGKLELDDNHDITMFPLLFGIPSGNGVNGLLLGEGIRQNNEDNIKPVAEITLSNPITPTTNNRAYLIDEISITFKGDGN